MKIIPFELHRRIQAFGTLGTHYATVVGGPAIEYGSHGQCQVTRGDKGLPPGVDGKTKISPEVGDAKSRGRGLKTVVKRLSGRANTRHDAVTCVFKYSTGAVASQICHVSMSLAQYSMAVSLVIPPEML